MTTEETLKIMSVLRASYPNFYKDMNRRDAEGIVNLWAEMFAEDDYRMVAAAVKSLIATDSKGFPPVIGQVKEKIRLLTEKQDMTETEAWALVAKAVKNSGYEYKEEYAKLPENIQRVVGSPEQLHDWSQMDSDTVHSVVASNFQRSFRARQKSEKEYAALPADVRKMIGGISERMLLEGGDSDEALG